MPRKAVASAKHLKSVNIALKKDRCKWIISDSLHKTSRLSSKKVASVKPHLHWKKTLLNRYMWSNVHFKKIFLKKSLSQESSVVVQNSRIDNLIERINARCRLLRKKKEIWIKCFLKIFTPQCANQCYSIYI